MFIEIEENFENLSSYCWAPVRHLKYSFYVSRYAYLAGTAIRHSRVPIGGMKKVWEFGQPQNVFFFKLSIRLDWIFKFQLIRFDATKQKSDSTRFEIRKILIRTTPLMIKFLENPRIILRYRSQKFVVIGQLSICSTHKKQIRNGSRDAFYSSAISRNNLTQHFFDWKVFDRCDFTSR